MIVGTTKATAVESDDMSLIGGFANVNSGGNNDGDGGASQGEKGGKSRSY